MPGEVDFLARIRIEPLDRAKHDRTAFLSGEPRVDTYLKTRAATVEIVDNSFDDTQGTATNYMIDLPSGSVGRIANNLFVQGRDKENYSAIIAVAAEERKNPSRGLVVEGNRASIPEGIGRQSVFVADWSGEPLAIGANTIGPGLKRFEKR